MILTSIIKMDNWFSLPIVVYRQNVNCMSR